MFLKSLELIGFKSFADKTHITFSEGITSLLGPNGCGKSNIVDAIKWVLGEQSSKTLRAGKMEDVIFNGTDSREKMVACEVTLVLDNTDSLISTPLTEIEIKRRVFRSGESQYFINKKKCLLKNIRDLFFDTGVGKTAYSILEQGKIDQILSSKPEDRRYIFEEAAGISRYKAECAEAERKIDRYNENMSQVEAISRNLKKRYESLKVQAAKSIEFRQKEKELIELDSQIHLYKVQDYLNLRLFRENNIKQYQNEIDIINSSLDNLNYEIDLKSEELSGENRKSNELNSSIIKEESFLNNINSQIIILESHYSELLHLAEGFNEELLTVQSLLERDKKDKEEIALNIEEAEEKIYENSNYLNNAKKNVTALLLDIENLNKEVEHNNSKINNYNEKILDNTVLIKQLIEKLALSISENISSNITYESINLDKESINEKIACIKAALKDNNINLIQTLLDELSSSFSSYSSAFSSISEILFSPAGLITQKRNLEVQDNEYHFKIENLNKINEETSLSLIEKHSKIESFNNMINNYQTIIEVENTNINNFNIMNLNCKRNISEKEENINKINISISNNNNKINEVLLQLKDLDVQKANSIALIVDLQNEEKALKAELGDKIDYLTKLKNQKNDKTASVLKLNSEIEKNEIIIGNVDETIAGIFNSFFTLYNRILKDYTLKEDFDLKIGESLIIELKNDISSNSKYINHLAEEEFKEVEEQYSFYEKELTDCAKARADLQEVLDRITEESKALFLDTYKKISLNFEIMFKRLFGGGKAEITLEDPSDILNSGINIFAQPPGKKMISLSLLSGGERSMTAVALLFATYLVKPSPFCVLDEIDAALDDKNIGYFLDVLTEFSQKSQFIIITHNKHTVQGSSTLLGVTQLMAGVSTIVTYSLANIKDDKVII